MTRKAWYFIGLTFSITWVIEGLTLRWVGDVSSLNQVGPGMETVVLVFVACMYVPALAVVIVQKGLYGAPITPLGLTMGLNRWWMVAVLLPIAAAVLSVGLSLLWPGVGISSGEAFLLEQLETIPLPAEERAAAKRDLAEGSALMGPALAVALLGVALVAGPTINALAAFGEELGWRGLLQKELAHLGFWRSSLVIGAVWGLWHLPLIVGGYNYPGMPVRGVGMMIVFTIGWSPLLAYLVVQGRSLIPAAMAHGTINATAGATYVFLDGGSRLSVGMLGVAGLVVLAALNLAVWRHQRLNETTFEETWAAFLELPEAEG